MEGLYSGITFPLTKLVTSQKRTSRAGRVLENTHPHTHYLYIFFKFIPQTNMFHVCLLLRKVRRTISLSIYKISSVNFPGSIIIAPKPGSCKDDLIDRYHLPQVKSLPIPVRSEWRSSPRHLWDRDKLIFKWLAACRCERGVISGP